MSLRRKLVIYVILLHCALGAAALYLMMDRRPWLLAVELGLAVSAVIGFRLIHRLFVPLELIQTGAQLIGEQDFTSKFLETGQPEMDRLIREILARHGFEFSLDRPPGGPTQFVVYF